MDTKGGLSDFLGGGRCHPCPPLVSPCGEIRQPVVRGPGRPAPRRVWAKWTMDEEVAESWEEAADSGVNNESLKFIFMLKANVSDSFSVGILLLLEVLMRSFHSHGPTMWLMLTLALRNLAS